MLIRPWRETIVAARQRGAFTDAERMRAAACWTTCAVGEQVTNGTVTHVQVHGTWEDGRMVGRDDRLRYLGLWFGAAVQGGEFDVAERLLGEIEGRAQVLKVLA